jgi:hypothetical protein
MTMIGFSEAKAGLCNGRLASSRKELHSKKNCEISCKHIPRIFLNL